MLIRDTLHNGRQVDLRVVDGVLSALTDAGGLQPEPDEHVLDGGRITPTLAEPHVHLDAALLGRRAPNRSGTLREGIANWARLRGALTHDDVRERALATLRMYARNGTRTVRTHVDTGSRVAVEALLALREEVREAGITLQVVAFPQEGILRGPGLEQDWRWAVAQGCDAVGCIPHFERTTEEGWKSVRMAFALAEQHGAMVDLHCDETDDPASRNLEVACAETLDRSMAGKVVAGHCTALHSYPNPHAAKVIELVALSGVQVVTNPLDNVVLQGRYDGYPRRRGLTRVDELWDAGASVGIGHDSVQDPWYPLGTAAMMDAAYMAVHLGQLTSEDQMERAFTTLWRENHLPFGGAPPFHVGAPVSACWWRHEDAVDLFTWREAPVLLGGAASMP